jgi:Arc/MetJ-type ribon-helix-helix transcriptional regulator
VKGRLIMGKKATFVLDEQVLTEAKEIVGMGEFKSMNVFVEVALKDEIKKIKREKIRSAIRAASNDPLFLADIKEIQNDFQYADFEVSGK